jgi:hypothetical protein
MSKTLDMARASHLDLYGLGKGHMDFLDALRRFEALVRADEREACAKLFESREGWMPTEMAAATIRSRGNT